MANETVEYKIIPTVDNEPLEEAATTFTTDTADHDVDLLVYVDDELMETNYALPNKVYTALKWLAILAIAALSTFIQSLGTIWGFDIAEPVALTITAVGTLLGGIVGVSALKNYVS